MREVLGAMFAVALALVAQQALAQLVSSYQAGVMDRADFEQWYAGLSGDYRSGAMYWTAHRSVPREAHCLGDGDQLQGCIAAQQKLEPFDRRRKSDPNYRLGWNGAPEPGLAAGGSASDVSRPHPAIEQIYHVQHDTFGCLNPSETLVLSNPLEPRRSDAEWVGGFTKDRKCVAISPRSPWKLVRHEGDVALMVYAGSISPPGTFYLRESDLSLPVVTEVAAPAPQALPAGTSPSQQGDGDHRNLPPAEGAVRRQTPVPFTLNEAAPMKTASTAATSEDVYTTLGEVCAAIVAIVMLLVVLVHRANQANLRAAQARRSKAIGLAVAEIAAKGHLLHVRREQLTQPDFYGTRDFKNWDKEKTLFADTRLIPLLTENGFGDLVTDIMPVVFGEIEAAALRPIDPAIAPNFSNPEVYRPDMDPVHYEIYCARQLQMAGWVTRATPKTGDQGADIVAERRGMTLVVQCKLYSSNVGNGAVQEAVAARLFHKTHLAVVVSNAAFTKSARQLAGMSDVTLLHHSQLAAYVGRPGPTEVVDAAD